MDYNNLFYAVHTPYNNQDNQITLSDVFRALHIPHNVGYRLQWPVDMELNVQNLVDSSVRDMAICQINIIPLEQEHVFPVINALPPHHFVNRPPPGDQPMMMDDDRIVG